jgi:hypothetical protein
MKGIISYVSILIILLLSSGCASVDPKIFKPQEKTTKQILPLELHIIDKTDINNNQFPVNYNEYLKKTIPLETRYIIYNEFLNNIKTQNNTQYGYAILKMTREGFKMGITFAIISGITLLIPNLFGFPFGSLDLDINMELEILDSNKKSIQKYKAKGSDTEYYALYWGYSSNPASVQVLNVKAIKNSLSLLFKDIENDSIQINQKLLEAGPIKTKQNTIASMK